MWSPLGRRKVMEQRGPSLNLSAFPFPILVCKNNFKRK